MAKYEAKRHLIVKQGDKKMVHVKAGECFDCDDSYYAEHLEPHQLAAPAGQKAASEKKSSKKDE